MKGLESLLQSGLLLPERSSGLSEFGSFRPSIGDEDLGYFAALDPRPPAELAESSSRDLFLSAELGPPFLSPASVCCLANKSWAAWSWASWAAYRLGLRASR